jgi:hypothetical protein
VLHFIRSSCQLLSCCFGTRVTQREKPTKTSAAAAATAAVVHLVLVVVAAAVVKLVLVVVAAVARGGAASSATATATIAAAGGGGGCGGCGISKGIFALSAAAAAMVSNWHLLLLSLVCTPYVLL